MSQYGEFFRRHLPHRQPKRAVFFVTFRLKGSLPRDVIETLQEQREQEKRDLAKLLVRQRHQQDYLNENRSFERLDVLLDAGGCGSLWLRQAEIAEIMKEALHCRVGREYELFAFCVMPNHVHVIFETLCISNDGSECHSDLLSLSKIMQSFKRHTARNANLLLGRQGAFWQDESYDHAIRNEAEFERVLGYVLENQVKAGLVSDWEAWPWTYCK